MCVMDGDHQIPTPPWSNVNVTPKYNTMLISPVRETERKGSNGEETDEEQREDEKGKSEKRGMKVRPG